MRKFLPWNVQGDHVRLAMVLAWFTVAGGLAMAADQPVGVGVEPSTIRLAWKEDHKSGHIVVSTTASAGLPALYVRASALKSAENFAAIGFAGNAGRDWIEFPAGSALRRDIPFDVTGLDVPAPMRVRWR